MQDAYHESSERDPLAFDCLIPQAPTARALPDSCYQPVYDQLFSKYTTEQPLHATPHIISGPSLLHSEPSSPYMAHLKQNYTLSSSYYTPSPVHSSPMISDTYFTSSPTDPSPVSSTCSFVAPSIDASEVVGAAASVANAKRADPCYAQLLWKCLYDAPDHQLSLREIYAWIAAHSPKASAEGHRGWMNSVRHNLSMNAVSRFFSSYHRHATPGKWHHTDFRILQGFQRVTPSACKRGSYWRLAPEAVSKGVLSTTRYRKAKSVPKRAATAAARRRVPTVNQGATATMTRTPASSASPQDMALSPVELKSEAEGEVFPPATPTPLPLPLPQSMSLPLSLSSVEQVQCARQQQQQQQHHQQGRQTTLLQHLLLQDHSQHDYRRSATTPALFRPAFLPTPGTVFADRGFNDDDGVYDDVLFKTEDGEGDVGGGYRNPLRADVTLTEEPCVGLGSAL